VTNYDTLIFSLPQLLYAAATLKPNAIITLTKSRLSFLGLALDKCDSNLILITYTRAIQLLIVAYLINFLLLSSTTERHFRINLLS
jgi:hypothetical protein